MISGSKSPDFDNAMQIHSFGGYTWNIKYI
jgi:hypothetical protein